MSGRGIWKRRREKKSQVDVIDRGGDFCVCVCLSAVGAVMCERVCVCVSMCVFYICLPPQVSGCVGIATLCSQL